jgi:hypothetical protein
MNVSAACLQAGASGALAIALVVASVAVTAVRFGIRRRRIRIAALRGGVAQVERVGQDSPDGMEMM